MEIRQLRYAVLLAECLHFGRAAERAFISQPSFSQTIARLEAELGTPLFDRSSNRVALTPAGHLLVERARVILGELDSAEEDVRTEGKLSQGTLRVGLFADNAGEVGHLSLARFRNLQPDVEITFVELRMSTQYSALLDQHVDVALLRPPLPDRQLNVDVLFLEPRVAILPREHRLAGRTSISVEDLVGEPFVAAREGTPERWSAYWCCDSDRGGPARVVASMDSVSESLHAVAHLGAVDTCPLTTARHFPHPGVVYVPLLDGGYVSAAVVTRSGDTRPHVRTFAGLAKQLAMRHLDRLPGAVMPEPAVATASLLTQQR